MVSRFIRYFKVFEKCVFFVPFLKNFSVLGDLIKGDTDSATVWGSLRLAPISTYVQERMIKERGEGAYAFN